MKPLRVTSFFFFVTFISLFVSCEPGKTSKKERSQRIIDLENIAYQKVIDEEYDSGVFYAQKMLKVALEEKNIESIKSAYNRLAINLSKNKEFESAIFYAQKLYSLASRVADTSNMAKAKSKIGIYYKIMGDYKNAYKAFLDSKKLYLKNGDSLKAAIKLLDIASLEKKFASFGASQLSAIEGLKYLENKKEIKTKSKLYYSIAVSAKEQGDLLVAEKRINQALNLAKDSIAIKVIGLEAVINYNNTKANILKEQGDYKNAIVIYERLLSDGLGKLPNKEEARINGNLAHTLFLKEGFTERADSLLLYSLSICEKGKYISELISINMKLSELNKEKDKQKSLFYADKVIEYAKRIENKKSLYEAQQKKVIIEPTKENVELYIALEEEIERDEDKMQTQLANAKFNYDQIDKERIEAQRKQLVADEKAAQGKAQNLGLLLILVIVIVVAIFIYQRIKRQHQVEKVKTVHVTEARISSKVHDELANDLYKLMSQLETTNPEKEVILDKLDLIYNQARDVSKQIQRVDTGEGFADELNNLFRSYQTEDVNVLLKRYNTDIWDGISPHIKITVYRVLQELLTNMKKHSNAALVVVSIEKQHKQLFIQYLDNGKGFTEEISKNGLQNAENRIHAIQGKLTFDTELHKGCKFSINVPV